MYLRMLEAANEIYAEYLSAGENIMDLANKPSLAKLKRVIEAVRKEDFGITECASAASVLFSDSEIISYTNIHSEQDERFSFGLFFIPKGGFLPLHDHPQMFVFSKILMGKAKRFSYSLMDSRIQIQFPQQQLLQKILMQQQQLQMQQQQQQQQQQLLQLQFLQQKKQQQQQNQQQQFDYQFLLQQQLNQQQGFQPQQKGELVKQKPFSTQIDQSSQGLNKIPIKTQQKQREIPQDYYLNEQQQQQDHQQTLHSDSISSQYDNIYSTQNEETLEIIGKQNSRNYPSKEEIVKSKQEEEKRRIQAAHLFQQHLATIDQVKNHHSPSKNTNTQTKHHTITKEHSPRKTIVQNKNIQNTEIPLQNDSNGRQLSANQTGKAPLISNTQNPNVVRQFPMNPMGYAQVTEAVLDSEDILTEGFIDDLDPKNKNLHSLEALEDCVFFDVLLPHYDLKKRFCNYYHLLHGPDPVTGKALLQISSLPLHQCKVQQFIIDKTTCQYFN